MGIQTYLVLALSSMAVGAISDPLKLAFSTVDPSDGNSTDLPPIIMLHGLTDSKSTWRLVAPNIAKSTKRKIYMLDSRNHGDSPWTENFNLDSLTDDVDDFMGSMGIPKAVIIGHSMGGRTAIDLALRKPERIEKLVIEDAEASTDEPKPQTVQLFIYMIQFMKKIPALIPSGADEQEAKKFVYHYINKLMPGEVSEEPIDGYDESDLSGVSIKKRGNKWVWKANLDALEKFVSHKITFKYEGLYSGGALFLYGNQSPMDVYSHKDNILQYFPNAKLIGVDAGHLIHNTLPQQFCDIVTDFINS